MKKQRAFYIEIKFQTTTEMINNLLINNEEKQMIFLLN
jgi:hypothetical protein